MTCERHLFEGDFIVTDDNLRTKVHRYQKGNKSIVFVSVNHVGSRRYFQDINNILDRCDNVLYEKYWGREDDESQDEGLIDSKVSERENSIKKSISRYSELIERYDNLIAYGEKYSDIFLLSPQEAFLPVTQKYWKIVEDSGVMYRQKDCVDVNRPNWEACDLVSEDAMEEVTQRFFENLATADEKHLIESTITMLEGMVHIDRNEFTYKHTVEVFKGGYGSVISVDSIIEPLATRERGPMEEKLIEKTDDKSINIIGIVYGAGHGPSIRRTIENLGFTETESFYLSVF